MDILDNDIEVDNNNEAMDAINCDKRHRRSKRSAEYKSWDLYVYTIAMFINHFAYVCIHWLVIVNTNIDIYI